MRQAVLRGLALASFLLALLAPTAQAAEDGFTISSGFASQPYLHSVTLPSGSSNPVYTCTNPLPWSYTIPNTQWISPNATCTTSAAAGNYVYKMFFTVTPAATNIRLSGGVQADNSVTITLNGNPVPLTPSTFGWDFQTTSGFFTGNTNANTLTFTVYNGSGPTGLDFHWGVSWINPVVGGPPVGLLLMPISKDQCKDGGWQDFAQFKNQGQCDRFVVSKRRKSVRS
jgi:hypothetical protein